MSFHAFDKSEQLRVLTTGETGQLRGYLPSGKLSIQLTSGGIVIVDEENVEKV